MDTSRRFLFAQGLAVAAAGVVGAVTKAEAALVQRAREWDPQVLDRLTARPAAHKLVFDCTAIKEGTFLNNIKNALNGFQFGFAIDPGAVHMIAALHGAANLINFDDSMWAKYQLGDLYAVKDPGTGGPALRNLFYARAADPNDRDPDSERGAYQDKSVQGLQARGVEFLICHTATEEQAIAIARKLNLKTPAEEIVKDLIAHRVPGTVVVPAMVTVLALLQQKGFAYVSLA
jgi:intracellular sulfur oxidation DsrE/DsrF family protein